MRMITAPMFIDKFTAPGYNRYIMRYFPALHKHARLAAGAALAITIALTAEIAGADYEWGISMAAVRKGIPSSAATVQFTPAEDPEYENKIMSYITAIDADLVKKITIVRVKSQPVTDYLFVGDRLYTIMESWGEIDAGKGKTIETTLSGKYGAPLVQQDKNFYIYSYKNDKTKVLYYLTKISDTRSKCTVYYYTKKLFRALIME